MSVRIYFQGQNLKTPADIALDNVLCEKTVIPQLVNTFFCFSRKRSFIVVSRMSPTGFYRQTDVYSTHVHTSCRSVSHLSCHLCYLSHTISFPHQNFINISHLPHAMYPATNPKRQDDVVCASPLPQHKHSSLPQTMYLPAVYRQLKLIHSSS